ncbi:MAG: hypothetical protein ABSF45_06135 [Terriglobia bacterium]|jgi:hypothetical protein
MAYITLAVTRPVIQEVNAGKSYQRQIAIQDASPELRAVIDSATAGNQVTVVVNDEFELSVGDTGAIWGAHQRPGLQIEDFTSLFDLLARRPDRPVKFEWK